MMRAPRPLHPLDDLTYAEYLGTPEWRWLSDRVKERDAYQCRICNSQDSLHAHHRRYPERWSEDNEANLTTLCAACHQRHHHQDDLVRALRRRLQGAQLGWVLLALSLIWIAARYLLSH
jgi:5-methylcytosine-specific restriction endonuclease McrA